MKHVIVLYLLLICLFYKQVMWIGKKTEGKDILIKISVLEFKWLFSYKTNLQFSDCSMEDYVKCSIDLFFFLNCA